MAVYISVRVIIYINSTELDREYDWLRIDWLDWTNNCCDCGMIWL